MTPGKPVRIPVKSASSTERTAKPQYDCSKCPGYCCSYTLIEIGKRDIARLAKHFGIDYAQAEKRFTKYDKGEKSRALRHQKDKIFKSVCMFFDTKKRRCTVYEARPGVCRDYPVDTPRCGYYEFLKFEREQQDDPEYIATT
jgi:Fe-S-cluster containining protein